MPQLKFGICWRCDRAAVRADRIQFAERKRADAIVPLASDIVGLVTTWSRFVTPTMSHW